MTPMPCDRAASRALFIVTHCVLSADLSLLLLPLVVAPYVWMLKHVLTIRRVELHSTGCGFRCLVLDANNLLPNMPRPHQAQ